MKILQYDLVEKINEGGSGSIYKGIDSYTGRLVVLKILHKRFWQNGKALEKFKFEANQYLYLLHPNIVRLIDFNSQNTPPFMVMDFVIGITLDDYIQHISGPVPLIKAVKIMNQLLGAIQFAHDKSVLHLDIKPSNLMIDKNLFIKVLDFGIGKKIDEVNDDMFVGSPYYMSPEQVHRNEPEITRGSDIYSLGLTFYQMLTGIVPFSDSNNKEDIDRRIKKGHLSKPTKVYPFIPPDIESIIVKAISINKEHRYSSCIEFQVAINDAINRQLHD